MTPFEVLELICDTATQEWSESGQRRCAKDSLGAPLWFIGDDVMKAARESLDASKHRRKLMGLRATEGR